MKPRDAAELTPGALVRIALPALQVTDADGTTWNIGQGTEATEATYRGVWLQETKDEWLRVSIDHAGRTWDVPVQAGMIEVAQ